MQLKTVSLIQAGLSLIASVNSEGLYSKNSAVLQISGKNYDKQIARSNQVSIVEFYAPWCGHCKNLKPEYERAAKGLKDFAQVAAVNCDEESNKAFCGSMGVQGFPTLKIVKPSKKPGKPVVEDYNGAREAKAIIAGVKSAIPSNVKRVTDKALAAWLGEGQGSVKALLFSNKGTTGALIKVLANEYLGKIAFAQIRDKETAAIEQFGITEYPTLVVLPGDGQEHVKYDGAFSKAAMQSFLNTYVSTKAAPEDDSQKPMAGKDAPETPVKDDGKSEAASSSFSEASSSHASSEAQEEAAAATSVTLEDASNPTESPDPAVTPDQKPIAVPEAPEPIPALIEKYFLDQKCLGEKTTTCVLALLPDTSEDDGVLPQQATIALASLAEVAEKHKDRGGKLFPLYSIPSRNTGSASLRDALKLGGPTTFELVAVNARRGWFRRFSGDSFESLPVEQWVDNIRFGEGEKGALPESLIVADAKAAEPVVATEQAEPEAPVPREESEAPVHEEEPAAVTEEEEPAPINHGEL